MKIVMSLLLCVFSFGSMAQQQQAFDGNWIKKSINAMDRVDVTRNGTTEDVMDSISFLAYVGGILAVHRQNNLLASIIVQGLTEGKKTSKSTTASVEIDKQMSVAFAFVPLLRVPDTLTSQQVAAILRKYLESNPEKWNINASQLITSAIEAAFEKK